MQETQVQTLGWKAPLRRKWQPIPIFLNEESHGQRSLAAYTVQGVLKNLIGLSNFHFHFT